MNPNAKDNLKPFEKGEDKRRNCKGRINKPDQFKALVLKLANEQAVKLKPGKTDGELTTTPVTIDGVPVANIEMVLRKWMNSDHRALQFVEYAYGKVPQPLEHTGKDSAALIPPAIEKTDDQLSNTLAKLAEIAGNLALASGAGVPRNAGGAADGDTSSESGG